jgi:serine/threonine-protein kinase
LDKIGKYQIIGQIGQGAMGVVYKAMDPFIERVVAVKTMSADLDADPEVRARFFREARSAGQLSHKNIVTIYDLGEEGGKAYMAMEFLDGEDLKHSIGRRDKMPLERKLEWMMEILEGLAHAHNKQVIHRDIKPGNIHITRSGQVKILDFGLARVSSSDITKTGSVMGTPNYMSPEQIRSEGVDHRSDIFSAGATFYELLTYRKPFHSSSLPATFFKILQQDPEPIESIDPSIPPDFSAIILRAMAKDPEKRYQNVDEMLRDLDRLRKSLVEQRRAAAGEAKDVITALDQLIEDNREPSG